MAHPIAPPPLANSILDTIGNTPLIEQRNLVAKLGLHGRLLGKLESANPSGSKKDRVVHPPTPSHRPK